jgi:hypothetical protein
LGIIYVDWIITLIWQNLQKKIGTNKIYNFMHALLSTFKFQKLNKIFQRTKYSLTQCQYNNLQFRPTSEDTLTEGSDYISIHWITDNIIA